MSGRAFLLAAAAALAAHPAAGADFSLTGFFSQRLDLQSDLDEGASDLTSPGFRTVSDLGLALSARTPRGSAIVAPGVRFSASGEERPTLEDLAFRLNSSGSYRASPRLGLSAGLSVIPDFATDTLFDDNGQPTDTETLEITTSGNVGASYRLNPTTQAGLGLNVRYRTYLDDVESLQDTLSYGMTGNLSHSFDTRRSGTLGFSIRRLETDADAQGESSESIAFSLTAGGSLRMTQSVSLSASAGPSFVMTSRTERVGADLVTTDDTAVGLVLNLGLSGQTARGGYSLSLVQDVDQGASGVLESRTSLGASASRSLTERAAFSVAARLATQTPVFDQSDEARDTLSITPAFTYALDQDWSLRAGLVLRAARSDESIDTQGRFFVQLSRGLSLLP